MTELFSEVYNCYFQVIRSLIGKHGPISEKELNFRIQNDCFEESILYLLPKLTEKGWGFFEKQDGFLYSNLSEDFYVPLTDLQKSYLKAILMDEKIRLFLSDKEMKDIDALLTDVTPLYTPDDFYYYDRFSDKDDYADPDYRKHFQTIVTAIQNHQCLDIHYESRLHHIICHNCLPCRIEYSIKNDRFRLLFVELPLKRHLKVETLNLNRIKAVMPTGQTVKRLPDINKSLQCSYYREPVRIIIKNQRNALERAMLQFANYEKSTRKLNDDTYECLIYYNKRTETELLIEILSFGPMLKVVGNHSFLELLKKRLKRQMELFCKTPQEPTAPSP